MSEMLGNQYFLGRNYSKALIEFENCIIENPTDKAIRRKLIICYTQTNNLDKALVTFYNLISEDIKFVMDADPLRDDCPCAELIKNIDSSLYTIYENKLVNGILWLFCDPKTSLEFFMEAKEIKPNNKFISQIINIIQNQIPNHLIKTE
jgi:tetratricopeptide (TPR) repeat protein